MCQLHPQEKKLPKVQATIMNSHTLATGVASVTLYAGNATSTDTQTQCNAKCIDSFAPRVGHMLDIQYSLSVLAAPMRQSVCLIKAPQSPSAILPAVTRNCHGLQTDSNR